MQALKNNTLSSLQSEWVNQNANDFSQEEKTEVLAPRHCIIPPAPTPAEAEELLSLELQMISLPRMQGITIDDVIALARVNEANLKDVYESWSETAFATEEPKSNPNAVTIAPGRQK
jgi:hypothetical protein